MKCLTEKVKFEYILDLKEVRELAIWIAEEKHSRQEEEQVQMLWGRNMMAWPKNSEERNMIRAEWEIGGTGGDKVREVRLEWDNVGPCKDFIFSYEWDKALVSFKQRNNMIWFKF